MGMSLFSDGNFDPPNPDPRRFSIRVLEQRGRFVLALVHYPGCSTFLGNKLLLFKDVSEARVRRSKKLDPHFVEGRSLSPFARFEPTADGMDAARSLADAWSGPSPGEDER